MNKEQIIAEFNSVIKHAEFVDSEYLESPLEINYLKSALALIKDQDEQIFKLQNLLKENENGYAQTLFLEKCKNKDLTEENEKLKKAKYIYATVDYCADDLAKALEEIKELKEENKSLAKTVNEASDLIRKQRARINQLKAYDEERDIALHARLVREAKQEVAREIFKEIEEIIKQPHTCGFSLLAPLKQALKEYDNDRRKELLYYVAKLKNKYIGEKGE